MPSLRVLKTFLAVVSDGSFTAAGQRVALTQSAVGLQIRSLEEDLRRPLFDRRGRTVALNGDGREFLPVARQMVELYDQALRQPATPLAMAGTVKLGTVVSALRRLVQATVDLKSRHAALDLHVSAAKSQELVAQVEAGTLDAAIVVGPAAQNRAALAWTSLYEEPMVLLAPAGLAAKPVRALIEEQPFIRFDPSEHTGQLVERTLRKLRARPREFLELNSIEGIVELVASGLGVAVLPCLREAAWARNPALRVIALPPAAGGREIGLVQSRTAAKAALVAAVSRRFQDL
ncbi:LysR family transcriptional regulator [Xylophilus rhododendri]|uniref:LysR family transcriptional regulator n=1 Tax=Xylophilus rhododendri TaxID=2697032 RepID=A0A857J270_9BURK|nr:LysR family transcriptional regulator [Xylophilus rhododendri]QHI98010.1 LysR family transcriptional regulator [Xylophilus rhododendri]